MASDAQLYTGLSILFLTLFLDTLELSFARILWFMRTLRFWLYFLLHFLLSCLAAYVLHPAVPDWRLLGFLATFLGVAVISNTNVKIAGYSLLPVSDLFISIKSKMTEQAAEDKEREVVKAQLIERLHKLPTAKIEAVHEAGLQGAGQKAKRVHQKADKALRRTGEKNDRYKFILIEQLVKANLDYVEQNIEQWEEGS